MFITPCISTLFMAPWEADARSVYEFTGPDSEWTFDIPKHIDPLSRVINPAVECPCEAMVLSRIWISSRLVDTKNPGAGPGLYP